MKLSGFQQVKVLGEGSYGKVYKTKRLCDNQFYALKIIDLNRLSLREIEDAVNEIRLMASVTSPFILSFYEAFAANEKKLCIVTEYARIGDLRNLIERRKLKRRYFKEEQIWQFLLEILEGLRILHSCGVVHRDLKSANILISAPDLVKIGDLGIATVLHKHRSLSKEMAKTQIGTPLYLAPEVWMHFPYDQKCDMWSLGVLLYEMLTFDFPFNGRTQDELQVRTINGHYSIPRDVERKYSNELLSILRRLLMVDPHDRPSVDELFKTKAIQDHMHLLNPFLQSHHELFRNSSLNEISLEGGHAKLLDTIHIPRANFRYNYRYGRSSVNLNDLLLPTQKYNKTKPFIKPIEQRIQMKKEIPMRLQHNLSELTSNEYIQIADQDLWTKNREPTPISTLEENDFNQQQQQQQTMHQLNIDRNTINQNIDFSMQDKYQPMQQLNIDRNQIGHLNRFEERQQQIKQLQLQLQQQQKKLSLFDKNNQPNQPIVHLDNGADLRRPVRQYHQQNSPLLPPLPPNHNNQPNLISPNRVAPRIIPARYAYLYKPSQNKANQDPRWKRKQPSLRRQVQPNVNDINNNIFFKQQQNVPWWFGQELQPSPVHQRKNPLVGFNPRLN